MKKINDTARLERNLYQREWRSKNKERVKKYNADYWIRRAERRLNKKYSLKGGTKNE